MGTRTLVRNVISIITLFLGKNRFNLHHFYLQCLFQESEDSLLLHTALPSAMSPCPLVLCVPRVSVDPESSLRAEAKEEPGFVEFSQEKEPIQNSVQW